MNFDLENFSSFSGWERLVETGMTFGTNLIAALAIFLTSTDST
jgi:transporter, MscS family